MDFTVMADTNVSPGRYVFFVEGEATGPAWETAARTLLDEELGLANPSYASNQRTGKLGALVLNIVQPNTFAGLKTLLAARGASLNQLKIPRVVEDEFVIRYLQAQTLFVTLYGG